MGFIRSLIKQTVRVMIVILPIKLSVENGVWSENTEECASLYSRLKSEVIPGTVIYFEELPSLSESKLLLANKWNRAVNYTFASAFRPTQLPENEKKV